MNYAYFQSVFIFSIVPFCTEQGAKKPGMIYYSIIFLSSFVSAMLVYTYMERRRKALKQKLLEKEVIEKGLIRKGEFLQEALTKHFEIAKQIFVMNSIAKQDIKEIKVLSKINELFYGEVDADANKDKFYLLFNELHENFEYKIPKAFPCLKGTELKMCCLLKAEFNTNDIGFIMKYTPLTVRLMKTTIRKKIGITDGGDIAIYLSKIIEE